MLDPRFIRENTAIVKENTKKRLGSDAIVKEFLEKDKKLRDLQLELDNLRHSRNKISEAINEAKKSGNNQLFQQKIKEAKELPEKIKKLDDEYSVLEKNTRDLLLKIPNLMHKSVPLGKDETQNKVIKIVGKPRKFDFPVKNHVELAEKLGIADFEASAKVAGNGFYYLKKELALLNHALVRFAIDTLNKKGYEYIETPLMLHEKEIYASMDKNAIEQSVYSIKGEDDLNLIGTAEQSLLAMHSDNTFNESELPKKYFSYSMCFRKEVGAHGINEKGLWRTHQFNKIEQFIFCKPEDSWKYYDELLKNTEEIFKKLDLPYRIIEMCSGDLSSWKAKACDIEVWRPTTKSYGEIASLSNCTDYQARKLNIKVIRNNQEKQVVHTLNNTAIATSRTMVAILENCQEKDGSIKIPKILQKYTGFKIIKPIKTKPKPKIKEIKQKVKKKTKKKK